MSERRFDPAKMAKLDNPERRKALPPEKILDLISIGSQESIADLGAGTGYFTLPAAQRTSGTVYALDVESQMLSVLQERVEQQGLTNVEFVQGAIEQIPLPDQAVNHVIASLVLHEVEPLEAGLQEIYRILSPSGSLLSIEWEKQPSEQGPPLHHRIHSQELQKALASAGFRDMQLSHPTDSLYIITANK